MQDGDDEYSLLVNLKRLYELQLSRVVPIENLYEDIVMALRTFRNMEDEVCKNLTFVELTFLVEFICTHLLLMLLRLSVFFF